MNIQILKQSLVLAILSTNLCAVPLRAEIDAPVKNISELNSPRPERVYQVAEVQVVIADYDLIRRDFVEVRNRSNAEINDWLIRTAGKIAAPQTEQTIVNTPIPLRQGEYGQAIASRAYRPMDYNRALVFPTPGGGFIDVKGVGSLRPGQFSHGNGLATTLESLREFVFEKKVQQILKDAGTEHKTVGCYAVFDFGFEIIHQDGKKSPAGAVLRQAHQRMSEDYLRRYDNTFLPEQASRDIELILRRYGMTSSAEGDWVSADFALSPRDVINIQGNMKLEIVDFGPYRVKSSFSRPTYWYPNVHSEAATPTLSPTDPDFVQPDPTKALKVNRWGRPAETPLNSKDEHITLQMKTLLNEFRSGNASTDSIQAFFNEVMSDGEFPKAQAYRRSLPNSCRKSFM